MAAAIRRSTLPAKVDSGNPKGIRGIDPTLWKRFRDYAWVVGLPVGELLNQVIRDFLKKKIKS